MSFASGGETYLTLKGRLNEIHNFSHADNYPVCG